MESAHIAERYIILKITHLCLQILQSKYLAHSVYEHFQRLEKMKKDKKLKEKEKKGADGTNRKALINIRVIQRNLVYVTNLSLNVAKEEVCYQTIFTLLIACLVITQVRIFWTVWQSSQNRREQA